MNFLTRQDAWFEDGGIGKRGYEELYLCFEGRELQYLQIPIAATAEETLKLFLP